MTKHDADQRRPLDLIVVEDSATDVELVADALREAGLTADIQRVEDEPAFRSALEKRMPDAILADWTLPHFAGRKALAIAREHCLGIPFIFVSGTILESTAIEALRQGATDYVFKHQLKQLGPALTRALDEARTLRALRESEQRYRTLANSGQALVWTAETDKLCNYFNKVWLDFTGRTLEQEMGNGWAEGVHPDDFQRCLDGYVSSFDRREKFSMDFRLRRYDGEYRWIQDDGSPRYDSSGEFIGYIGYCLDITGRKLAEAQLAEQIEELRRWHDATSGREERILDLKHEINELMAQAGQPPRYPSAEQSNAE